MFSDARALMPTDLLALVAHGSSSSYENQAWPKERLGTREAQPTLTVLRDQLLVFGHRRNTWVSVRRQSLKALVGARERGGKQAWEIDYLVDCSGDSSTVEELLGQAVKAAGESRAEKLFLRLEAGSALLKAAHDVGFVAYQEETLLEHPGGIGEQPLDLRRTTPADAYPLFRLYTRVVPEAVRRYEAATYGEWQAAAERRWMRGGVELVLEEDSRLVASVRAARLGQGVMLELLITEDAPADVGSLVAGVSRELSSGKAPLLAHVSTANPGLVRGLEEAGFQARGDFVSLMHRTTRPLTLPKAMPVVAKNVVGA